MKLIWIAALAVVVFTSNVTSTERFTHTYDTFEFTISPPPEISIKGVEWGSSSGWMIDVNLKNNENFFVWNSKFYDWETRDTSNQNLIDIWAEGSDSGQHSAPTITNYNGAYVVTGRMIRMDSMITRTSKIYDFDNDGLVDWETTWNIKGKYDFSNIEKLAANSYVVRIQPDWD